MIQKLLICLLLVLVIAQDEEKPDYHSAMAAEMYWSYLELRPPDIFVGTDYITTIDSIAINYYGHSDFARLIYKANPSITTTQVAKSYQVFLPSLLSCVDFFGINCLRSRPEHDTWMWVSTKAFPQNVYTPLDKLPASVGGGQQGGRRMLLDYEDIDSLPGDEDSATLAKDRYSTVLFVIQNNLFVNLEGLMDPYLMQITPFSQEELQIPLTPGTMKSLVFFLKDFHQNEHCLTTRIYQGPIFDPPFKWLGSNSYIEILRAPLNQDRTCGNPTTLKKVTATDGVITVYSAVGNLQIKASIDNKIGSSTAFIEFNEDYSTSVLLGQKNQIREIKHIQSYSNGPFFVNYRNETLFNFFLFSTQRVAENLPPKIASQYWKFIPALEQNGRNYFRILNARNNLAITLKPSTQDFIMETPDETRRNQVWVVINAAGTNAANGKIPDAGETLNFIRAISDNLCWVIDNTEKALVDQNRPLRLENCNPSSTSGKNQVFSLSMPNSNPNWGNL